MKNIKTIYFIILLIFFVLLGIIIVSPELIPSFEMVQVVALGVIYLINIVLVYIIIIRLWHYLQNIFAKTKANIFTTLVASIVAFALLISFIITSLSIGQGYMGGKLYKELNYHEYHVTLFLYDDGFLDPLTTVKIKNRTWPLMKNYFYIENCEPSEIKTQTKADLLELSSSEIVVTINLKTREIKKTYINSQ